MKTNVILRSRCLETYSKPVISATSLPGRLCMASVTRLEKLAAHVIAAASPAAARAAGTAALEAERRELEARLRAVNSELHDGGGHTGPLAGITIIESQQAITGPLGTMMLADMGATVIKIESPNGPGDVNRPSGAYMGGEGDHAAYFHNFNRGKRCIALDLTTDEGIEVLKELVKTADIFVSTTCLPL